jgi:hypothetical protein
MAEKIDELEVLFQAAKQFVESHYHTGGDERDKNIKILATMNQLIELKKLPPDLSKIIQQLQARTNEQKG